MNAPHDTLMAALGRVASGVYILTAGGGDRATGMLTSWVMQAGFEPPMVTVAVRQGRYVGDWLAAGESFVLNIAGQDQKHLLRHFGKGFDPGEAAFEGLDVRSIGPGLPVLVDAIGHLLCEPTGHVASGDHRIFLARVVAGEVVQEGPPMTHVRKSGTHY